MRLNKAPRPGDLAAFRAFYLGKKHIPGRRLCNRPFYYLHRRLSKLRVERWNARFFFQRRRLAQRARAAGMERIRPGLWYDRAADVVYMHTSQIHLEPIENIRRSAV